ncbi:MULTISPECIES: RodZ domain-containing protein [unclassified Luteibacter]|uniref:helix-turn-helix domain-containing protein n=1 Tax=unclassified Luteibacter TaxID=2620188 RepID=UPI0008CEC399|nr:MULTISPECIES: RodZ domain-containing protein [unclassified Luteibacter]MDR6935846.1 cytoskeleton protein RodZ [Luteibacter sp. 3190]SEO91896.1 cytoskeleton protein RodZ [Luteibacter sp. UNC138MFCol5.1]SEV91348.1 cytoskeleton protein RodZ [Luteibacter sp. 329MFSha]
MDPQVEASSEEGRVLIDLGGHTAGFGARLRAAREARGYTIEACGQALRLPTRLLRQLEAGEYGGIDYQVYLAGYLTKYGTHLGIDESEIQAELARHTPRQPELVVTGGVSHSRYLFERYLTAATYVVLTAVIVVPMVWLGVRGTLDRDMARLAPLDAAPVAQQDAPAPASSSAATSVASTESRPAPVQEPRPEEQQPLLASMAMFPPLDHSATRTPLATAAAAPEAAASGAGAHSLSLNLPAASWVEVTAADGSRLEYGILPAGTQKSYRSDSPLDVRIGNASAAQVTVDGQPVQLDAFRRANVARFRVDIRDGKAAPVAF